VPTGGLVDIGEADGFRASSRTIVRAGGQEIGVFHLRGEFVAVRNVCPHRGAPVCHGMITGTMVPSEPGQLAWGLDGLVLRCPWHRWEFDLRSGKPLFGIDERRRLRRYDVVERDGRLLLRLPDRGAQEPSGQG
jgi:nitrite reductase (NADH) small subunit